MICKLCEKHNTTFTFKHTMNSQGQVASVSFSLCKSCIEKAKEETTIKYINNTPEGGC
jgi:hypothetical protein